MITFVPIKNTSGYHKEKHPVGPGISQQIPWRDRVLLSLPLGQKAVADRFLPGIPLSAASESGTSGSGIPPNAVRLSG